MWDQDDIPTWNLSEEAFTSDEPENVYPVIVNPDEQNAQPDLPLGHHVVVFSLDPPGFCSGRISDEGESSISVTLDHEPDRLVLWPLSVCVVAFLHEGKMHAFLARLWRFGIEAGVRRRPILTLSKPNCEMSLDWRSAPRVAVPEDVGIEATLHAGTSGKWSCKVRNLSVTGALLEFDQNRLPEVPTGSEVELDLVWSEGHIRLLAVVCRRSPPTVALMFPESVCEDEIRAPMYLEVLVRDLQTLWLMRKAA